MKFPTLAKYPYCHTCGKPFPGPTAPVWTDGERDYWLGCQECWEWRQSVKDRGFHFSAYPAANDVGYVEIISTERYPSFRPDVFQQVSKEHLERFHKYLPEFAFYPKVEMNDQPASNSDGKGKHMRVQMKGEPFSDTDDDGARKVRKAGFDINGANGAIARCRVQIIEEEGEPAKLAFAIGLVKDPGFETLREEVFSGSVATAFAEIMAHAHRILGSHHSAKRPDPTDDF